MSTGTPMWRASGWVIGAVVGLGVALGSGVAVQQAQEDREDRDIDSRLAAFERVGKDVPAPVDAVRALLDQPGPVVVDPLVADRVSPEDLARAEALVRAGDVPSHLAYLSAPLPHAGYSASGALAQWAAAVGATGHYVILFDNGTAGVGSLGLEEEYLGSVQVKGQPGPALVRIAEEMTTWEAEERVVQPPSDEDDWGGISGGVVGLLFAGGLLVVPAFLILRHFLTQRRKEA